MNRSESATDEALKVIRDMLSEPDRHVVLRCEVIGAGVPPGPCDRVLRKLLSIGEIVRFGQGVYCVAGVKLFTALDEVLQRLGIKKLPSPGVRGYSQYLGGNVVRTSMRVARQLRHRGVRIRFETPNGKLVMPRSGTRSRLNEMPSRREIEDHYHSFERCHSMARAEKDLLVGKAVSFLEQFDGGDCALALEGGTALAYCYKWIQRFSEDLGIRFIPPQSWPSRRSSERIERFRDFGQRFAAAVGKELPWLTRSKKGRFRPDGSVQPLIFDFTSRTSHADVTQGIKFELVDRRWHLPLRPVVRRRGRALMAIDAAEIAAGKWQALATRLPRKPGYADLVRHPADLAQISSGIGRLERGAICEIVKGWGGVSEESLVGGLDALINQPQWELNYLDYMERMGTRRVSEFAGDHLPWDELRNRLCAAAVDSGLVHPDSLRDIRGWAPGKRALQDCGPPR